MRQVFELVRILDPSVTVIPFLRWMDLKKFALISGRSPLAVFALRTETISENLFFLPAIDRWRGLLLVTVYGNGSDC